MEFVGEGLFVGNGSGDGSGGGDVVVVFGQDLKGLTESGRGEGGRGAKGFFQPEEVLTESGKAI